MNLTFDRSFGVAICNLILYNYFKKFVTIAFFYSIVSLTCENLSIRLTGYFAFIFFNCIKIFPQIRNKLGSFL